jgi:hypothetical protein
LPPELYIPERFVPEKIFVEETFRDVLYRVQRDGTLKGSGSTQKAGSSNKVILN